MVKDSGSDAASAAWASLSNMERESARRRRALVSFWLLTILGAGVGGAVGWSLDRPLIGLPIGLLAGAVVGAATSFVMWLWPVLRLLWHWALELGAAAVVVGSASFIAHALGSWWWSLLLLLPVVTGAAVRPVRHSAIAWVGCVVTRHRLRVCFASFLRVRNKLSPGLAPLILLSRPTPAGERVWLWLRPGLDANEIEERSAKVAVACWASDVLVAQSRRFAALVRLDITRRDPLTGMVRSPLLGSLPSQRSAPVVDDLGPLPTLVLDLGTPSGTQGGAR